MKKIQTVLFIGMLLWTNFIYAQAIKPNVWILTDLTSATSYPPPANNESKALTDGGSDPDDHVAMAMYMMMANRFNTKKIVLASTTKNTSQNTAIKFNETFGVAYEADVVCLNAKIGGFPSYTNLNVIESSLTAGANNLSYSNTPDDKYDAYNNLLPSVKLLVDELKKPEYSAENPLYVLVWGPMTEIAMVTKHLIRNNQTEALNRLYVISHWTSSFTNQTGTPCSSFPASEIQFKPANCSENCQACAYMHNEAKKSNASFRFVDLGSVGQQGVVNGSQSYFVGGVNGTVYNNFKKSKLGDLFVKSKFVFGKPDGSDCATFLALLGTYGVKLSDYNDNGVLTKSHEETATTNFKNSAVALMMELTTISNNVTPNCSSTGNILPKVALSATPATANAPASITLTANASDEDGTITKVDFFNGTTLLGSDVTSPYTFNWTTVPAGTYSITAKATDDKNAMTISTAVSITVNVPTTVLNNITDLTAVAWTCPDVKLTWTDVAGETGYRVRRKTATTNYIILADVPANTTSYVDTTVEENTTYQYMVRPMQGGVAVAVSNTPQILTAACTIDPVPVDTYLKAYPNPTTGILTLPEVFANDQIKVVSQLSGNTVLTRTISQNGSIQLDITSQPSGNYIIQVIRNNQLLTRQIIKL